MGGPKSKEFGAEGKYYQHDIAEAKKLLGAAGFPNGLDADSYHITTAEHGLTFSRQVETLLGMAQEAGLHIEISRVAFADEYQRVRDAKGNFEGMSARLSAVVGYLDVGDKLSHLELEGGVVHRVHLDTDEAHLPVTPKWMSSLPLTVASLTSERTALALQLQRLNARKQYTINSPGRAAYALDCMAGAQESGIYIADGPMNYYTWLDETQPPLKKT